MGWRYSGKRITFTVKTENSTFLKEAYSKLNRNLEKVLSNS